MSPRKKRRKFSPEDKATILRRHLADKVPVSDLWDECKIQPSLIYPWQRQQTHLHDARRGHRGRESFERLPRPPRDSCAGSLESEVLEKRPWFETARGRSPALAFRRGLCEPWRPLLLPDQRPGRLQPLPGALGAEGIMATADVEIVIQRARERFPGEQPRIISDNGSAYIARDFKSFIRKSSSRSTSVTGVYRAD